MAKNKWLSEEIEIDNIEYSTKAIDYIVNSTIKTETRGRKSTGKNIKTKAYSRITISLTEKQKNQIKDYIANNKDDSTTVSSLIKDVLTEYGVISKN